MGASGTRSDPRLDDGGGHKVRVPSGEVGRDAERVTIGPGGVMAVRTEQVENFDMPEVWILKFYGNGWPGGSEPRNGEDRVRDLRASENLADNSKTWWRY